MQAYNAQQAGANAILVMDDRDESLLTMSNPEDRPELAKLKNDINIPAGLVRRVGHLLRKCRSVVLASSPCSMAHNWLRCFS